jgi:hypothetical protein
MVSMGCALWLLATGAFAETVRVDALRLDPEAGWQRGAAAEEKEYGSVLLEWSAADPPLEVALPHRASKLKTAPEVFFEQLRARWQLLHGREAAITWLEVGDRRWLVCAYPSRDSKGRSFHLVTLHDGKAYGVLATTSVAATSVTTTSVTTTSPPQPVLDLIAGARFGELAQPAASMTAASTGWKKLRLLVVRPERETLDAWARDEAARLGDRGMLTGYGVEAPKDDAELSWFLEGFRWRGTRDHADFELRGHLLLDAPARWDAAMRLEARLESPSSDGPTLEAQTRVLDVCAPRDLLEDALKALEQGDAAPLDRLAGDRPSPCPAAPPFAPIYTLIAEPGHASTGTFSLDPAPALEPEKLSALRRAGLSWHRIVGMRPGLAGDPQAFGQGLVRHLGMFFVYGPE